MSTHSPHTFEDVVDEIMLEEEKPTHEALVRWTAQYPKHREALSRFFATWALQETSREQVTVDEARAGDRMLSKALDFLAGQPAAATLPAAAPSRLSQAIKSRGLTDREFAKKCDLDESLVDKLDLRRIPSGIPQKLHELAAAALDFTIDAVRAMFTGEPIGAVANKAKNKPTVPTEDFLAAVDSSDLPEDLKARWVEIVNQEQITGGNR
ncbi:hypothetical protein GobsT_25380 [Gemmata obscuriglobus]|uniref:Uncharacterized protein n=1 Tax=Gemmata obscuriglobus TaxID=114 RepID=A0A2Z3H6C4_9BACT|nr:hypothetical protein [Gemmata obscuriglobus]AWM39177.1 hypothetical protein C1280_20760 [Gemmata obscuriglobus]QEG27774.1 hypothetical protein GobsT_25380 [Gemmata obscuriglobus]VTS05074.1 Uncharacterized protein OS=Nitratireductor aquibiodomus RA22 GN=A33O_18934 PE=4 SV=1 [Gemmata obscuriglobus UQM 2246]